MRIKDFETLSRLIGGDVRKQYSVLKRQFHAYIMRRMRWHARRYYYRNRDKVITISLEDMNEDVPDEQEEERMRCRELLIALQQELPHLTPTERQIAQSLLKKSCNETAAAMELCNSRHTGTVQIAAQAFAVAARFYRLVGIAGQEPFLRCVTVVKPVQNLQNSFRNRDLSYGAVRFGYLDDNFCPPTCYI